MTSSHRASPERTRSPWLFVALAATLVAALAVLGFFFGGSLLTQVTTRAADGDESVTVGAVTVVAPNGWVIVPHYFGSETVTLRSPDARLEVTLQVPDESQPVVDAARSAAAGGFEALAESDAVPEGVPVAGSEELFWIDETPKAGLTVRHASVEFGEPPSDGQGAPGMLVGAAALADASSAAVLFTAQAEDLDRYRPAIAGLLESIGGPSA